MSTTEQDAAAAAAAVKEEGDDDNVEAELFGEEEDDDDDDGPATSAPVDSNVKADDAPSSFSIPKKESSAGGGGEQGTPTGTAAAATASTATTPSLASPTKHDDDVASPKRKLSNGGGGAVSLELPDEVVVPDSAKLLIASDRSNRLKTLLLKLPVDQMSAALEEYDEAIQQQKPIRNHIGYLTGVLKRYLSIQERTNRPGDGAGAMGEMTAAVKGLIQTKLFDTGFCTEIDLDEKLTSKLKQLPEREAMAAIEEISRCDRSSIRNFPSYFMGILHRYMRGERDNALGGSGGAARGGADGPHYGGRRPPHHHDNHHRGGGPPPSHHRGPDRYGGGRDDRDRHYGRGFDDRGRDRSSYGDRRGGRYDRDRSPEYDRRRDDHHRDRGRERDRYGDRRDRDRSPDGYYGGGRSRRRYSSRSRSRSRSPSDSRSPYGRERKYSRDEGSNAARRESRWGSSSSSAALPGASPISQPGLSQYGPSGGTSSWGTSPPQRQQPVGTRVFAPAPAPVAPPTSTGYYGQQPPVVWPLRWRLLLWEPMDLLLRLFLPVLHPMDKSQESHPQHLLLPHPFQAWILPVSHLRPSRLYRRSRDSLSLLLLAAADTAVADLPLMVQYSLTNLKTTGHIDPAGLDPGVCRMLKNVPEHIALSALEKFQSCDTSLMRNKNSYMAGIIKRKRVESGY